MYMLMSMYMYSFYIRCVCVSVYSFCVGLYVDWRSSVYVCAGSVFYQGL